MQERAYRKIRDDITTFYVTNKSALTGRDLLALLSFAHMQSRLLSKFNVDTTIITDLSTDLLRQLSTVTQVRLWQPRLLLSLEIFPFMCFRCHYSGAIEADAAETPCGRR